MVKIREIRIRNFRSIVDMTLIPKDLSVLVGLNDSGKSNVLKALNLFFNNQTDENRAFDFSLDYSKLAPKKAKQAPEIVIQIKLEIPMGYKDSGLYVWKKTWRATSSLPTFDSLNDDLQKNKFSTYSKTPILLKRITYTYVPATKSHEYFMRLLGTLYSSISADAESEINTKTIEYSKAVQQFTNRIGEIVKDSTGIQSALTMPPSQIDVFRLFTFSTKDSKDNDVLLEQRGDGIKARHIPAILKFISEYYGKIYGKNSIPVTTIWGYEEPETGIELSRCFEFSKEFLGYSNKIQMLITTHSPAFYSLEEQRSAVVFYICKDTGTGETAHMKDLKQTDIHKEIGLMPIITPFIKEKEEEIKRLRHILYDNYLTDIPTLFVEGKTDRDTLLYIIPFMSPKLQSALDTESFRIHTKDDGCGTTQVAEWAMAWKYSGFRSKIYLLFDKDKAGIDAKHSIDNIPSEQKPQNMKYQYIKPSMMIVNEVFSKLKNKNAFTFELEHLYTVEFWKLLADNSLVNLRDANEMMQIVFDEMTLFDTCETIINGKITNVDVRETIFTNNIKDNKKSKILDLARKEYEANPSSTIFEGFIPTIQAIEKYFCS